MTVLVKAAVARWINITLGGFFTAIMLLIAATAIAPEWAAYVLYALLESILTIMIVVKAWRWPKAE
jgi:hypothetical protein